MIAGNDNKAAEKIDNKEGECPDLLQGDMGGFD